MQKGILITSKRDPFGRASLSPLPLDDLEAMTESGRATRVNKTLYREVDPAQYKTRMMTAEQPATIDAAPEPAKRKPARKTAKKKATRKKATT